MELMDAVEFRFVPPVTLVPLDLLLQRVPTML